MHRCGRVHGHARRAFAATQTPVLCRTWSKSVHGHGNIHTVFIVYLFICLEQINQRALDCQLYTTVILAALLKNLDITSGIPICLGCSVRRVAFTGM